MASAIENEMAHGMELRIYDRLRLNFACRKELYEIISEEDKIIKSWSIAANQSKFCKLEFFHLLRKTLLFLLSPESLREAKRKELLKGVVLYFNVFTSSLRNNLDVRKPFVDVICDPWKNMHFSWDDFFQRKISVFDPKVQRYFAVEPEDIVLARVHSFVIQGHEEMAMTLAKSSYIYHSRIANNLFTSDQFGQNVKSQPVLMSTKHVKGVASLDWYLFLLQRKKSLPAIVQEIKQLSCHEGVQLVQRLRRNRKNQAFVFAILQILILQEFIQPSKFCCTKKIFSLWVAMHYEKKSGEKEINDAIAKMVGAYSPSSAHFYLFADALWEQFAGCLVAPIIELYIRGLTVDINHLEAAKHREDREDVDYLETHIASIFTKLSTLFSDRHEGAARECMFSAFSLKPTKERLYILQSLTHSILCTENDIGIGFSTSFNVSAEEREKDRLFHPILNFGLYNIHYSVLQDLVTVLEGVRCFQFQYNIFDWHNNAIDLGDYLKDYNVMKSWESDTEYASEGSNKSDIDDGSPEKMAYPIACSAEKSPYPMPQIIDQPLQLSTKRKNESNVVRELFSLDVGANCEVGDIDNTNKRIKLLGHNASNNISNQAGFDSQISPIIQGLGSTFGMEDAIENVIRITLDKKERPDLLLSNSNIMNIPLNHMNDSIKNIGLSSINKPISDIHGHPYSVTSSGKRKIQNFNPLECSSSAKSSAENVNEYLSNFVSKPSKIYEGTTSLNRKSVISPVASPLKNFMTPQKHLSKASAQNSYFSHQSVHAAGYNHSKDCLSTNAHVVSKMSTDIKNVQLYQNVAQNMCGTKNNSLITYEKIGHVHSANSSTAVKKQTPNLVNASAFSKSQFSVKLSSISSSSSMTSSTNVLQSKEVPSQLSTHPSTSHSLSQSSSVYRSDYRYPCMDHNVNNSIVKRIDESICYQDSQLLHDRSSVIQHTMQHLRENYSSQERNDFEIPNQLTVSVNTGAAEQIRCAPKKGIPNLPPFTVNICDKAISKSSVAVSANLVLRRNPHSTVEISTSQQVSTPATITNSDTIIIPGILASPSVIVTPRETQQKRYGNMMYKKHAKAVNTMNIEKRIYKNNCASHNKQVICVPEFKLNQQVVSVDKNRNPQLLKAITSPRQINPAHGTSPSSKQTHLSNSQTWLVGNKSATLVASEPSSSQPWYSEPYPKPSNGNHPAFKSTEIANAIICQSTAPNSSLFQPIKQVNVKSLAAYKKPVHPPVSISSSSTHSLNNPVSQSSVKSCNLSNINPHTPAQTSTLHKQLISVSSSNSQPDNTKNKSLYPQCSILRQNLSKPSAQYADNNQATTVSIQEKIPAEFTITNAQTSHQYCHLSAENFPNSCCSPSEINPCQNCSLPPVESNLVSSQKNPEDVSEPNPTGTKMNAFVPSTLESAVMSSTYCYSNQSRDDSDDTRIMIPFSNINDTVTMCQFCSKYFLATEFEIHILNSHAEKYDHGNYITAMGCSNALLENANTSVKSLPDVVPEQDTLFQKKSFQDNLPQTKPVMGSIENQQSVPEDVKNIDDIAFNTCMDLINSNNDLKRMVQGIDTLDHIENNYLPFMDSAVTQNYLNPDLTDQIQNIGVSEILELTNKDNNYSMQCNDPQLKYDAINSENMHGNVFEFTEKDFEASRPAKKLIHSKPVTVFTEKNSPNDSKNTNELSFSTLAQMIKDTINETDDCSDMLQPYGIEPKYDVDDIINPQNSELEMWSCQYCCKKLRSSNSLKRHIRKLHGEDIVVSSSKLDILPPVDSFTSVSQANNVSVNLSNMENNSLTHLIPKQNLDISSTLETGPFLPKGRIKGIVKSKTCKCDFCGRILTLAYMKKHIQKQHPDQEYSAVAVKNENTSSHVNDNVSSTVQIDVLNAKLTSKKCVQEKQTEQHCTISARNENSSLDLSGDANMSSESQADASNITAITTLPEPDIDSSTCLSVSDALKRNSSYTITDASNLSNEADKLTESTNVKFNFNEISKDVDAKASTSKEDQNLFPTLTEPCLTSGNVSEPEEVKVKPIVSYTKQSGFILKKFLCNMCTKAYSARYSLKKHLKQVHNVELPAKNQSKKLHAISPVSSMHLMGDKTSKEAVSTLIKESLPQASKIQSCSATSVMHKSSDKYKNSLSEMNGNLLKTVLKSNFVTKQLEAKHSEEEKGSVSCKSDVKSSTNLSKEAVIEEPILCNKSDVNNSSYNSENCELLKPNSQPVSDLQHGNKISDITSSKNLGKSENAENEKNSCVTLLPQNNLPPTSVKNCELNNVLKETDKIPFIAEFTCDVSFENSTVQSNEISPISEIISNITKCHFVGAADKEKDEKILDDNSLKLLIPINQKSSTKSEKVNHFDIPPLQEIKSNQEVNCETADVNQISKEYEANATELISVDMSENLEVLCSNMNDNLLDASIKTELITIKNVLNEKVQRNLQVNKIRCRLCQCNLESLDKLTKHLKEVHEIPVLKKQVSEQFTPKLAISHQESEKLSPPKLKLGSNETDSDSISDFDNPLSKITNDSFETVNSTSKVVCEENSCISTLSSSEQLIQKDNNIDNISEISKSVVQHENTETEVQLKQLNSNSGCQRKPVTLIASCKYKFRRNSFSDNLLTSDIECKNTCGLLKVKSVSLPNFQVALNVTTSCLEHELKKSDTPVKIIDLVPDDNTEKSLKQSEVEHSAGENTSFSNVTDATEVSKTSCDLSYETCPFEITVKSDFLIPKPILKQASKHSSLLGKKNKISSRELILQNIKKVRKRRAKRKIKLEPLSCNKSLKSRKYRPIIVTLKKATEISDFLKTHKQPTVKLIRLKEDSAMQKLLNNRKKISVRGNSIKKAVVKIEKLHIPSDDLFLGNQKLIVSNKSCLSSIKVQGFKNQSIKHPQHIHQRSHSTEISHFKPTANRKKLPEIIDLTEDSGEIKSLDAHQSDETLSLEVKPPGATERCYSVPHTKRCLVVLKRLST